MPEEDDSLEILTNPPSSSFKDELTLQLYMGGKFRSQYESGVISAEGGDS